jgi:hypothetical protein
LPKQGKPPQAKDSNQLGGIMGERRALIEGLKPGLRGDPKDEQDFVYGPNKGEANQDQSQPVQKITKSRLSTQIRSDIASALKRASLERQLKGIQPSTMQEILEQAIEPWLKSNGYLS